MSPFWRAPASSTADVVCRRTHITETLHIEGSVIELPSAVAVSWAGYALVVIRQRCRPCAELRLACRRVAGIHRRNRARDNCRISTLRDVELSGDQLVNHPQLCSRTPRRRSCSSSPTDVLRMSSTCAAVRWYELMITCPRHRRRSCSYCWPERSRGRRRDSCSIPP